MSRASELADGNEKCAAAWIESSDAHKFRMDTAAELRRLERVNAELVEALRSVSESAVYLGRGECSVSMEVVRKVDAALTSATKEQQK